MPTEIALVIAVAFTIITIWTKFIKGKFKVFVCSVIGGVALFVSLINFNLYSGFLNPTIKSKMYPDIGLLPLYEESGNKDEEILVKVATNETYFHMEDGEIIQPIGMCVPLSISRKDDKIFVSAIIKDYCTGKIIAKMINNEWKVNQNEAYRIKKSKSCLEVFDNYDIPVIQIKYVSHAIIKIGGVFKSESDSVRVLYPDFPCHNSIFGGGATASCMDLFVIVGEKSMTTLKPVSDKEIQQLINYLKKNIRPWSHDN